MCGSEAAVEIIGVGLDATEIERVADMIDRYGDRFLRRVFTDGEMAYCRAKRDFASSYAARFAAKEAAMKALGTGQSRGVYWTGIEVKSGMVRHALRFMVVRPSGSERWAERARSSRSHIRASWPLRM